MVPYTTLELTLTVRALSYFEIHLHPNLEPILAII